MVGAHTPPPVPRRLTLTWARRAATLTMCVQLAGRCWRRTGIAGMYSEGRGGPRVVTRRRPGVMRGSGL